MADRTSYADGDRVSYVGAHAETSIAAPIRPYWAAPARSVCASPVVPDTQDFGVVQFSGPFESAQSVPDTTVQYTIIGKTLCGGDVRKITTRTYSARSVDGQEIGTITGIVDAFAQYGGSAPPLTTLTGSVVIGATYQDIVAAAIAITNAPATADIYTSGGLRPGCVHIGWTNEFARYQYSGGTIYQNQRIAIDSVIGTAYYLDVHEVWTYELINWSPSPAGRLVVPAEIAAVAQ